MIRLQAKWALTVLSVLVWQLLPQEASAQKKAPVTRQPATRAPAPPVFTPRAKPAAKPPVAKTEHAISATLDGSYFQLKDKLATPLLHEGFISGIRLGYDRASAGSTMQSVNLGLRLGDTESRLGTKAEITGIALDAGWAWEIFRDEDSEFRVYAGASLNLLTQVHFFPSLDESHAYWLTSYEARPLGVATYRLTDRSSLRSELSFPLAAIVSRPDAERFYNNDKPDAAYIIGKVHENLAFTSLHEYQAVQLKTGYRYRMNESFAEQIHYEFRYIRFDQPQEVQLLSHALLLTLEYLP